VVDSPAMPLPDCLLLLPPRQPTAEVRAGRAYRAFSGMFLVLLTVAIALFVASLLLPPRWQWPLWVAAAVVITLTAPLRAWGLRRGLLSYFVHGIAVEGTICAVDAAGERTWRVRYRYEAGPAGTVEAETLVYDAAEAPFSAGDPVAVLFRKESPRDSVLPAWCGVLPDADPAAASAVR